MDSATVQDSYERELLKLKTRIESLEQQSRDLKEKRRDLSLAIQIMIDGGYDLNQIRQKQRRLFEIKHAVAWTEAKAQSLAKEMTNLTLCTDFSRLARAISMADPSQPSTSKQEEKSSCDLEEVDGYTLIYTDGFFSKTHEEKAGCGVWWGLGHKLNTAKPVEGRASKNAAMLLACIHAISAARNLGLKKIKIITDDEYVVDCATKWASKVDQDKQARRKRSKKSKTHLGQLKYLCNDLDVKWELVAMDCEIEGVVQARKLAQKGAALF